MNTSQLECFISLANTLNYMKTSEQLGLTQPAVTKQIYFQVTGESYFEKYFTYKRIIQSMG